MMKPRMILAAALAAFCLAGCATTSSGTSPPGTTVAGDAAARTVFATKSAYAGALAAAVAYKRLAPCSATVKQPCSDPAVVAQLQRADNVAAGALDAAEAAVRTPSLGTSALDTAVGAASAALAAMNALLTSLGTLQ